MECSGNNQYPSFYIQISICFQVLEPPAEYLEEDLTSDDRVPPDALYMLHSIRVFGHFEKPVFLMLCKHTEILNLPAGSFLFKVGKFVTFDRISKTIFYFKLFLLNHHKLVSLNIYLLND